LTHFARGLLLALLLGSLVQASRAESFRYCDGGAQVSTVEQDRLLRVAAIVKAELERSGQRMALVARSGLALQRFGQRYSHAGVSLKASPNTPWSVRQLYYACDEKRPRIFDQGMSGFVLGANDPEEGYLSIVLLPAEAAASLEQAALDDHHALQMLGTTYSANAYPFSQQYQNCNQWLAELIATAWGALPPGDSPRKVAQAWLKQQGYTASVFNLGWRPVMWVADMITWLHSDDHPPEDIDAVQFTVSMPASIESFVRSLVPQTSRLELCYTAQHVVVRRGWEPIADGCMAAEGDDVITLNNESVAIFPIGSNAQIADSPT
jgi:hypothetical protein